MCQTIRPVRYLDAQVGWAKCCTHQQFNEFNSMLLLCLMSHMLLIRHPGSCLHFPVFFFILFELEGVLKGLFV
jgi:hypothetical protein